MHPVERLCQQPIVSSTFELGNRVPQECRCRQVKTFTVSILSSVFQIGFDERQINGNMRQISLCF